MTGFYFIKRSDPVSKMSPKMRKKKKKRSELNLFIFNTKQNGVGAKNEKE